MKANYTSKAHTDFFLDLAPLEQAWIQEMQNKLQEDHPRANKLLQKTIFCQNHQPKTNCPKTWHPNLWITMTTKYTTTPPQN